MSQDEQRAHSEEPPYEGEAYLIEGRVQELEREQAEAKKRDAEYKRLQVHYDKLLTRFTGGLLFVGFISLGVYTYMAVTTRESADAAKNAVNIAEKAGKDSEASAANILTEMQKQSGAMQAYAKAAKSQAESSKQASQDMEKALNANIAASHLDERPWVGVVDAQTQGGVETDEMFSFQVVEITIRNSGKTPAIKMSGRTSQVSHLTTEHVGDYDSEERAFQEGRMALLEQLQRQYPMPPPPPGWEAEQKARAASLEKELFPEGGVLAPGAVSTISVPGTKFRRHANDGRSVTRYILGKFTYFDTIGGPQHTTKFCLMRLQGNFFSNCATGNWMD